MTTTNATANHIHNQAGNPNRTKPLKPAHNADHDPTHTGPYTMPTDAEIRAAARQMLKQWADTFAWLADK